MPDGFFVDVHSHVCPSGDDGAQTLAEGLALCDDAAAQGTAVLFATPHVWPALTLTPERERAVRAAFAELRETSAVDLRLGFELTPSRALLSEDLRRYALDGAEAVLLDTPFTGPLELLVDLGERAESQGLRPVLAHPERAEAVRMDSTACAELARRGWLLQVNATSLLGRHGEDAEALGWNLVEDGLASLVASDGHRTTRPARLGDAFAIVQERLGKDAVALFDGSALGLAVSTERIRSRAASRDA